VPPPAVAVVDAHLDHPAGQVGEADVDVDPVVANVEQGRVDVGLDPGAQLTAHLGKLWVQRQPRLPVDVEAPVLAPLEQDDHPVPWAGSSNTCSSRPS
jgi:hypothetical protein